MRADRAGRGGEMRGVRQVERTAMVVRCGERCPYGRNCRYALAMRCRGVHTAEEERVFAQERQIFQWKAKGGCAHCKRQCCRYGAACRRGPGEDSDYEASSDGDVGGAVETAPEEYVAEAEVAAEDEVVVCEVVPGQPRGRQREEEGCRQSRTASEVEEIAQEQGGAPAEAAEGGREVPLEGRAAVQKLLPGWLREDAMVRQEWAQAEDVGYRYQGVEVDSVSDGIELSESSFSVLYSDPSSDDDEDDDDDNDGDSDDEDDEDDEDDKGDRTRESNDDGRAEHKEGRQQRRQAERVRGAGEGRCDEGVALARQGGDRGSSEEVGQGQVCVPTLPQRRKRLQEGRVGEMLGRWLDRALGERWGEDPVQMMVNRIAMDLIDAATWQAMSREQARRQTSRQGMQGRWRVVANRMGQRGRLKTVITGHLRVRVARQMQRLVLRVRGLYKRAIGHWRINLKVHQSIGLIYLFNPHLYEMKVWLRQWGRWARVMDSVSNSWGQKGWQRVEGARALARWQVRRQRALWWWGRVEGRSYGGVRWEWVEVTVRGNVDSLEGKRARVPWTVWIDGWTMFDLIGEGGWTRRQAAQVGAARQLVAGLQEAGRQGLQQRAVEGWRVGWEGRVGCEVGSGGQTARAAARARLRAVVMGAAVRQRIFRVGWQGAQAEAADWLWKQMREGRLDKEVDEYMEWQGMQEEDYYEALSVVSDRKQEAVAISMMIKWLEMCGLVSK